VFVLATMMSNWHQLEATHLLLVCLLLLSRDPLLCSNQ